MDNLFIIIQALLFLSHLFVSKTISRIIFAIQIILFIIQFIIFIRYYVKQKKCKRGKNHET